MKLYYAQGACSLAPHIVMTEMNMAFETELVNLKDKTTATGADYYKVTPKGAVPALKMDNGEILTEGAVICQYVADMQTNNTLFANLGTMDRVRIQEWMNFIATDIHKNFSPLFFARQIVKAEEPQAEMKEFYKKKLDHNFMLISERLGTNDYLMGKNFTIADAYLFTCMNWCQYTGLDYSKYSNIAGYMKRIAERPAVVKAMKAEGLMK